MPERESRTLNRLALLVLASLMSACVAGGPIYAPGPEISSKQSNIALGNSVELATSNWGPDDPKAVIFALHGYGDHAESTFSSAARFWAERGIRTIAIDQRGFGRNPSRGYWPGADALVEDAISVSKQIRGRYPCIPIVALGHSMGGGVVLAAAAKGLESDRIVLAVPAIWGGSQLNPLHRMAAWWASLIAPDVRFSGRGFVRIQASDNIEALRALQRDPLYLSPPSAREIMGLVRITDRAAKSAPSVRTPALMLLGSKDQIVPRDAVRTVFQTLAGPKSIIEYPNGWHLIFRDLQAEPVWHDTTKFALTAAPPAGCPKPTANMFIGSE